MWALQAKVPKTARIAPRGRRGRDHRRLRDVQFTICAGYPPFMWPAPGRANLAVANTSTSTVGVLRGNANGAFQVRVAYPGGGRPFGVAAFVAHS